MSVRSEHWSPTTAPSLPAPSLPPSSLPESSLGESCLGASDLPASSLPVSSLGSSLVPSGPRAPRLHWARFWDLRLHRAFSDRRGGVFVAAMLAVVGAFFVWQSWQLDLGNADLPGPGFFPLVLGAVLVIFSIIIRIGHWRAPQG